MSENAGQGFEPAPPKLATASTGDIYADATLDRHKPTADANSNKGSCTRMDKEPDTCSNMGYPQLLRFAPARWP